MREIVHIQAGQCGNQIGAKVRNNNMTDLLFLKYFLSPKVLETPKTYYTQHNYPMYLNGTGCCLYM